MATACHEEIDKDFEDIHHFQFTWLINNVYMCRTLLETEICGPSYGEKIRSFPWVLKLGQSTKSSGISLFISGAYMPTELVNFHASVRSSAKCLLDDNFKSLFGFGHVWESPVLITNDQFKTEASLNDFSDYWKINVELIWVETVGYQKVKEKYSFCLSELLRRREVGTDLQRFVKNEVFSDITINSENTEIPAHKAILYARSPYLAKEIDSLVSGEVESSNENLILSECPEVVNTFLKYVYTGDVGCMTEDNPLPIGIHKCARSMQMNQLEWLTAPFAFHGKTVVKLETVRYEWVLSHSRIMVNIDEPITIDSEPFGNPDKDVFSLQVTINPAGRENCSPSISVNLKLEDLEDEESIYAIVDLSVKAERSEILFRKKIADKLTSFSCMMRFPEFLCKDKIREIAYWGINDLYFNIEIIYSRDELDTSTDRIPFGTAVDSNVLNRLPEYDFSKTYQGWMTLTSDLSKLLMYEKHSDCSIVVGEERLPAHRIILAARSPYFSKIFEKKEEECKGSSNGMEIFVEKDIKINPNFMKKMLEEMYTGSAEVGNQSIIIHTMAKFFGLRSFRKHASDKYRVFQYLYRGVKM